MENDEHNLKTPNNYVNILTFMNVYLLGSHIGCQYFATYLKSKFYNSQPNIYDTK